MQDFSISSVRMSEKHFTHVRQRPKLQQPAQACSHSTRLQRKTLATLQARCHPHATLFWRQVSMHDRDSNCNNRSTWESRMWRSLPALISIFIAVSWQCHAAWCRAVLPYITNPQAISSSPGWHLLARLLSSLGAWLQLYLYLARHCQPMTTGFRHFGMWQCSCLIPSHRTD